MDGGGSSGVAPWLRVAAIVVAAGGLAGCPILPATYETEAAKTVPAAERAILHGAFREYVVWYWQITITAVDGQAVTTPLRTASRVELEPGEHRVEVLFEVLTIGQTEPVTCTFTQAFEGRHDYHVLRLENALKPSRPMTLVISDRGPEGGSQEIRRPCVGVATK